MSDQKKTEDAKTKVAQAEEPQIEDLSPEEAKKIKGGYSLNLDTEYDTSSLDLVKTTYDVQPTTLPSTKTLDIKSKI